MYFQWFFFSLDLDGWINEPLEETDSDSECENVENLFVKGENVDVGKEKYQPEPTEEEKHKVMNFKLNNWSVIFSLTKSSIISK